ncbi:AMP-binding protein [Edaphobacter albus]|uniref:AMP-binding protein n=1 Tax=Edaphobacter sp. 4G125 TaxID=2763071 RepID=UPI0016451617|nr:AMP-binding protein [Edaphobacter sp. 4G125]QNI35922.1 AMP-binding protein [Edaphobacter sp. 4G125]
MRSHLATLLEDFRRFGSERAVVRHTGNRRKSTSYEEIARLAGRFAALLDERGILVGDRVIIWAENSAQWISAFYGCMLRGVLAVPLDVYGTVEFATRVASDVRPSLIVGDQEFLRSLKGEWSQLAFEDWLDVLPAKEMVAAANLSRDTPLQILFTSGTTGDPKGIVHTHGNILASLEPIEQAARGYMRYERLVHPLRFLHTLPLSHVFGQMMGLWVPAVFAAEVHFESRLVSARLIETVREERISVVAAVPRVLAMLKNHLETEYPNLPMRLAEAQEKSSIRRWWYFRDIHSAFGWKFWAFVTGGSALSVSTERFWTTLSFVVVQGYGMTETAALITLNHPFHISGGSMGKPLPGREVKMQPDGEVLVRGPMVSSATWSGGSLHPRESEWLATGDLAKMQSDGALRFLGRKSETIVTGSGVNLHPEDLEVAFEQEPEVRACAVVPMETASGSEPCVVLAMRGSDAHADTILQRANAQLAEFQRIRRYALWPDPDLPRTSTGKVKRAEITAWLANKEVKSEEKEQVADEDWLLRLIARITGENPPAEGEKDLRLTEDLHLDSLGRVQLFSALEQRLGLPINEEESSKVETLKELRQFVMQSGRLNAEFDWPSERARDAQNIDASRLTTSNQETRSRSERTSPTSVSHYVYPRWPWSWPVRWLRSVFLEVVLRPLVWLLAAPRIVQPSLPRTSTADDSMLIVANHVSTYDVPLLFFALQRSIRTHTAVAMAGEMLEDFRRARRQGSHWPNPAGPIAWFLLSALFNVFPLPRQRDFQRSFDHMGRVLDRGFHIILFPEGRRSPDGTLADFRRGIGLLVKQSSAPVLPVALCGLGNLKMGRGRWFRSGRIEIHIGQPLYFGANETETAITERLQLAVKELLTA